MSIDVGINFLNVRLVLDTGTYNSSLFYADASHASHASQAMSFSSWRKSQAITIN